MITDRFNNPKRSQGAGNQVTGSRKKAILKYGLVGGIALAGSVAAIFFAIKNGKTLSVVQNEKKNNFAVAGKVNPGVGEDVKTSFDLNYKKFSVVEKENTYEITVPASAEQKSLSDDKAKVTNINDTVESEIDTAKSSNSEVKKIEENTTKNDTLISFETDDKSEPFSVSIAKLEESAAEIAKQNPEKLEHYFSFVNKMEQTYGDEIVVKDTADAMNVVLLSHPVLWADGLLNVESQKNLANKNSKINVYDATKLQGHLRTSLDAKWDKNGFDSIAHLGGGFYNNKFGLDADFALGLKSFNSTNNDKSVALDVTAWHVLSENDSNQIMMFADYNVNGQQQRVSVGFDIVFDNNKNATYTRHAVADPIYIAPNVNPKPQGDTHIVNPINLPEDQEQQDTSSGQTPSGTINHNPSPIELPGLNI